MKCGTHTHTHRGSLWVNPLIRLDFEHYETSEVVSEVCPHTRGVVLCFKGPRSLTLSGTLPSTSSTRTNGAPHIHTHRHTHTHTPSPVSPFILTRSPLKGTLSGENKAANVRSRVERSRLSQTLSKKCNDLRCPCFIWALFKQAALIKEE